MTITFGDLLQDIWHFVAIGTGFVLSLLAAGLVVLHKRDSRAAIA
jgi:hypothetical protein